MCQICNIRSSLCTREQVWSVKGNIKENPWRSLTINTLILKWRMGVSFSRLYPKQGQSLVYVFVFFSVILHSWWMMWWNFKWSVSYDCSFDLDLIHEVAAHFHAQTQEYWAKSSKMSNRVQPIVVKISKTSKSGCWRRRGQKQLKPISYRSLLTMNKLWQSFLFQRWRQLRNPHTLGNCGFLFLILWTIQYILIHHHGLLLWDIQMMNTHESVFQESIPSSGIEGRRMKHDS